jgi:hypothetical protein
LKSAFLKHLPDPPLHLTCSLQFKIGDISIKSPALGGA